MSVSTCANWGKLPNLIYKTKILQIAVQINEIFQVRENNSCHMVNKKKMLAIIIIITLPKWINYGNFQSGHINDFVSI